MELIHKSLDFEVRQVGEPKDRTLEFIGSTAAVDRYGDIIEVEGWDLKNFKKNSPFLWAHNYSAPPVGTVVKAFTDERGLICHTYFHTDEEIAAKGWPSNIPTPETVYRLYLAGSLKATSVGFSSKRIDQEEILDKEGRQTGIRFKKQELYELSAVTVPANPFALIQQAVQKGIISEAEAAKFAAPEAQEDSNLVSLAKINPRLERLRLAVLDLAVITPADDYLEVITALCDLVDAERIMAADVVAELKELIPEQVIKAGAVLSAKNKVALTQAQALIQSVLDAAEAGAAGVGKEQGKGSYYSLALSPGFDPEGGRRAKGVPATVNEAIKKFMQ